MIHELKLTADCIAECSRRGQCDADVAYWVTVPKVRKQLDAIPPAEIARHLKEFGAWDTDELGDHEANLRRLLWVAAGHCKEENDRYYYVGG